MYSSNKTIERDKQKKFYNDRIIFLHGGLLTLRAYYIYSKTTVIDAHKNVSQKLQIKPLATVT